MARGDLDERAKLLARRWWIWAQGPGKQMALVALLKLARQIRRNLVARRVLSFPHFLVAIWIVILLWGERWVFESKVQTCAWKNWESWPKAAHPHHLIFIADPQITDPHSYPGRPWPLSSLTVTITDNYLRRGYKALQRNLNPDSVFFLGDLFDGGREWKTRHGTFTDPHWGSERSKEEKSWVKTWHRRYGEDYWVREYQRFASIYFDDYNLGGDTPGAYQRGKKLVASLPGNHDLGFGAQVQISVRDRFAAFFGDVNRVDIVGNHSIVSVDTVSLSASASSYKTRHNLRPIYGPATEFLENVQSTKRKLAAEELAIWHDNERDIRYKHLVEDIDKADRSRWLRDPGEGSPDFPTILLTHVPLYREPGTPCGPMREHWPPQKPPKGQIEPVKPDERNAISVSAGYQYQNVLNEDVSVNLLKSVGNVIHVFSGDDHDYCELVHSKSKGNVREITVKSISMAMGVPTPGFVMASLYNPVGPDGKPILGSPEATLQTHLCLLPNQFHTYMTYIFLGVVSIALLAVRALLVPTLHLTPFALEPEGGPTSSLPMFKDKEDPPDLNGRRLSTPAAATSSSNGSMRWAAKKNRRTGGWSGNAGGPRIKLDDVYYDGDKTWKTGRGRVALGTVGTEMWTTSWRVAWMVVLYWSYLARKG